ncbi:MAG: hypothetical protein VXW51_04240 [Pseudomonadota bacterium]|nr:hypothetical protein [Pseudomonadota bacterium]
MKRFLIPLLAALALPTDVNANLINEYNQQQNTIKKKEATCRYLIKNIEWDGGSRRWYYVQNNKVIKIKNPWNFPSQQPNPCFYFQIGIINQEYQYKSNDFNDALNKSREEYNRTINTFSRYENGVLVIYNKNSNGNGNIEKIITKPYVEWDGKYFRYKAK